MSTLSQLKRQFETKQGVGSMLTDNQIQTAITRRQEEEEAKKNQGGFFGGLGYVFEKIGLGFLSSIEGIWDYTAGGLAKLFGADDWAEQQFANDWVDYNHADEWYNPSEGWKVAGDVAGGIGTSLPAIVTVAAAGAITVASGGTLSPVAASLISAAVAGLGAAGRSTKEAYDQTGELGGKEFGYGALSGITEGAVEGLSAGIGAGTGSVIKNITKSFGKEVAASTARQTLTKTIFKSFVGEAFEEGLSEILDPVWKRLTYDPNAKNATFQEVGYAALIGGLSGAIMGGVDTSIRSGYRYFRGNTIVNSNQTNNVLSQAQQISEYETKNHTGYESFESVQSLYQELQNSMKKTNGEVRTVKQKTLLGLLESANTSATFTPFVAKSAENIVNNAELIAEKLTSYGFKDANGNPITFTAEQITEGIDITKPKTFTKALKNNAVLRSLAVADAAGQLTMDTAKFQEATLRGQKLSSQADLNRFIETATDSERRAVSEKLGIDDWNSLTNDEFQQKITDFVNNGGVEQYQQERLIIRDAQNVSEDTAQRLPRLVKLTQDGTYRFKAANADIAVVKNGDMYRVYDYESGRLSNELTKAELNRVIKEINSQTEQAASAVKEQLEQREQQENRFKQEAQEIDNYARENIKDYAKLNANNQSMVRAVIRQGRAAGVSESVTLYAARVSAHSGLNVVFSKQLSFVAADGTFADGAIDLKNNRIIINPEAKNRTGEMILIHELTHAIYTKDGVLQVAEGLEFMTDAEKEKIRQRYSKIGRGSAVEVSDEINAHFAEQTLSNKNIIERLVADKPTIKDKILNFFKKAQTDYTEDEKLTGAAKKLFKQYKKLFDEFSAANRGNNAIDTRNVAAERLALAKDEENSYNNQKGVENGEESEASQENTGGNESLRNRKGQLISVFNDNGTARSIQEITKNKDAIKQISSVFDEIYTKPQTETQENLQWHAKEENIDIFFAKSTKNAENVYFFDGKKLILSENASEKTLVDILNIEKPVYRDVDVNKTAHISEARWNKFLQWRPDAYLTRIPIQQFLDMTTDSYVEQRQINARSSNISQNVNVNDIQNTSGEYMYLEIDLDNKTVINHEGRHRMTALLNAGNGYADVFVIFKGKPNFDSLANMVVKGQFNNQTFNLGLVKAQSKTFSNAIQQTFRTDDGNIRYALPETDSTGKKLSQQQREYFNDSKVVDEQGNLRVMYHGTGFDFNTFDIKRSGLNFSGWSALGRGFYFVDSEADALRWAAKSKGNAERVVSAYLNITNPFYTRNYNQSLFADIKKKYNLSDDVMKDGFTLLDELGDKNVDTTAMLQEKGFDGIITPMQVVAFSPNQIKEISNINPTIDDDIRYALNSDEDIRDLVAIHNTTESKLLQTIELGGLPMPSIAIIRNSMSHENFGNISLIFKSQSIDPNYNYDNKVYSADAYSPRFPQVAYSLNSKELKLLADKLNTSVSMLEANEFAEGNNRSRIIESLKDNDNFIRQYMKEFGVEQDVAYKKPDYSSSVYLYEGMQEFLKKDYSFEELLNNAEVREELDAAFENAKSKQTKEFKKNMLQSAYNKLLQQLSDAKEDSIIYDEVEKRYNNDKQIAQGKIDKVVDSYQTRRNTVEKLKNDSNFNKYAEETVDKILKKKYLRNNKNYYTNTGNPRSFEALYDEYTAENAVQIMKEQGGKNSEGGNIFGYGIGEIRAALSKKYESISDIRQDEYRLQESTEDSAKLYEECNDELHSLAERLSNRIKTGNFLEERDIALNAIFDIIASTNTNDQAHRLMKRDYSFDVTDVEIVKIRQLAKKVAELPVKYFEAKPERVVGFNEVIEVIAPKGTNQEIINFFEQQGTKVALYDANTDRRSDLIKQLPNDVRFALQSDEDSDQRVVGGLTRGQRAKFVANNTKLKVYSRSDAASVINNIIDERLVLEDKYGSLSGKSKTEVVDMLFRQLNATNEGYRGTAALHIADYLIENTVLNDMYVEDSSDIMRELSILRSYMHNVDLKSIQGEINYKYDKKNSIALIWGAKEGGQAPDVIAQELNGLGIHIEAINEADCFFEMVDKYNSLRSQLSDRAQKQMLKNYGSEAQRETLRQQIARDILLAYDEKGTQSKYGKLVEKYTTQIESLKRQVAETRQKNNLINNILEKAQKMKDLKLGTFLNATDYKTDVFQKSIESLAKIKYRGNLNAAGTRRIMADLKSWYTTDNPMLADIYESGIADMLDTLASGGKNYSVEELGMLRNVMSYFTNLVENYNRVYKQGKWIEAIPEAERYINTIHSNDQVKVGLFRKITGSTYMQTFGDPMTVARRMDMYESGFYTEMLTNLRDAAVDAQVAEMEIKTPYNNFLKAHKKYLREITKTKVNYQGVEVPKAQLISLYMTLKRQQAQAGLAQNGFAFVDTDGKRVRVQGFAPNVMSDADLLAAVVSEQTKLDGLLTDTDREFISILETVYNQDAKKLKADRDMQRLGFTNATEDYYYPIRRGNIAKNVDTSDVAAELDRVSNASFNKDTIRGAKQELFIESADTVFNRHLHAVCQYSYLSPAIETYNRIYNLDISGNKNKPVSVATESANTWSKGNKYFSKLISDIQGIPSTSGEGMKALGFLRGSYAKFQLGANPKVWVTQLSSLFASSSILDTDSIIKGMTVSAKDVDTYCSLAKLRNSDNTAAMAQGVLDRSVGKVSDALMAPIGKMDRFVVNRLFGACQVQVAKDGGAKVGTEANKVEAGKLLRRVILETQQNSIATERSAAMRSGNEVLRTVTMFTADSMKVVGRVIDSIGELSTLRAKLRAATDADVQARLKTQIKAANRKVRKSVTSLITSAAFMACVAKLFRWLYNKEDDDEAETVVVDFVGNLFGGLPLVKDVYARLAEGYDINNYAYSTINDLLDSAVNVVEAVKDIASGSSSQQQIAKGIKNMTFAAGQLFGIPTRNLYNITYGLTKRISPTTGYKIDSIFYSKNYVSDLKEAIANDDAEMIATIMSLLLNERVGSSLNSTTQNILRSLYARGYSVLPKSVGSKITYNGETITLTSSQQDSIKKVYSQANKYVEKMVSNRGFYKLNQDAQAKAIKQIYDAFYSRALAATLGTEDDNKISLYSKFIDIDKLSMAFAGISQLSSDKDGTGNTIAGSKKKNVINFLMTQNLTEEQRLLIYVLQGYSIQDYDFGRLTATQAKNKLLKYILSLRNATQAEKSTLAQMAGFEVSNGKIIVSKAK